MNVVVASEGGGAGEISDPYLILLDSNWNVITFNDDCGSLNSAINCAGGVPREISLAAGTYIIEATTFFTETGDIRLSLVEWIPPTTIPINVADPDPYPGGTIDGTQASINRLGSYATYFEFTIGGPMNVVVAHEGGGALEVSDPYLYLMDSGWNVIASNDNCGISNAAIACSGGVPTFISLAAGTYIIEATTFGVETGDFRMSLFEWTPPPTIPINVADPDPVPGGTINGTLNSINRGGSYATYYEFTLGAPTDVVITHSGGGAGEVTNPYLFLLDSNWNVITSNDDCGVSSDSAINCVGGVPREISLPAGTYIIEATTNGVETGDFRMSLFQWTPPPTIPITVAAADPTSGTIDGTMLAVDRPGSYATYYEFTLVAPANVVIAHEGGGGGEVSNPYLYLLDNGWNVIASNDDCGSSDAAIDCMGGLPAGMNLAAGTYIIEVTTNGLETGDFRLSLTEPATIIQPLSALDSGWYSSSTIPPNHTTSNTNYITGGAGTSEYRSFFVFDLSGVTGTIVNAALSIENPSSGYMSDDPSETFTVFDVNVTSIANLVGAIDTQTSFDDIGGGTAYGSANVGDTGVDTPVDVTLNASAVSDLNLAIGGQFAFGGAVTSLGPSTNERIFGFSSSGYNRVLYLEVAP
jgi:hypothetical protein